MVKTIKFQSSALLPQLSLLIKVVNTKNAMPILNDFRIEVIGGNKLGITASDGETWLTMSAQATEAPYETVLCIDAKSMLQVVSNLNGKDIAMDIDDAKHVVNFKYDKGHCTLPYEDAMEYPRPKCDFQEKKAIQASAIYDAISRASFAVANDDLRQVMNGVHFDFFKDAMVSVATDAKKLVKMENLLVVHYDEEQDTQFTLPTKPCNLLLSLLAKCDGDIRYAFDERNVVFRNDDFNMVARLVEGRYPNYNAVIPRESTKFATICKEDFLLALKHVLPMGSPQTQLVALRFATVITSGVDIIAQDIDFNKSAQEHVECEYTGEDITIGFNGAALLQLVQNVNGDKFMLAMDTPQRAGVITEGQESKDYRYTSIIMPMLVNV